MQSVPLSPPPQSQTSEEVVSALPFPVFVADARRPHWPLLQANPAFVELVGPNAAANDRPLGEILGVTEPEGAEHESLDVLLARVRDEGVTVRGRRVDLASAAGSPGEWWLTLTPLTHTDGVRAVMGVLVDDIAQGRAGHRRRRRDVLRSMATGLIADRTRAEILEQGVAEAATATGARRAAVMLSDGGERFRVVATVGESELPPSFDVPQTADALIDVAMGRTRLALPVDDPDGVPAAQALPFSSMPGWEKVLLVGLRVRAGGLGLLAVADPVDGEWDDGALERLDLAAVLFCAALEGTELRTQFGRIEDLLRGAVLASTTLMGHTDPASVRGALVERIVADMQLDGAALWLPDSEDPGRAVLVAAAGLPDDVRDAVSILPPGDAVAATAAGHAPLRIPLGDTAARAWPDHYLHVVPVPEPAEGALGVYSRDPLPSAAVDIFAALAQAMASGVEQTTLHRRARSVVDALQRRLQPRMFDVPPGFDAGHIYRSATAGVPIGGDFVDVFATATGHIGLACGDVSGKGIEAAALSAMAVYSLRAFALQGAMPRVVTALMDAAVEAQTGDDRFLTMAYARIHPRDWTVELSNAGHQTPILVRGDGARLLDIDVDVPVGMLGTSAYHQKAFHLEENESLVLYTDGVTEARSNDSDRTMFGIDRLVQTLHDLRDVDAQAMAEAVWERVQEWSAGETTDDCAVVVLRRCPEPGPA